MWQNILVGLTGIAVVIYVVYKVYHYFRSLKRGEPLCSGCSKCAPPQQMKSYLANPRKTDTTRPGIGRIEYKK